MAYSFEIKEQARELYVVDGLTLDQVAEAINVDRTTLARWSSKYGWRRAQQDFQADLDEIRANTIKLRKKVIGKVLASLSGDGEVDPQKIYAVSSLEGATAKLIGGGGSASVESAPEIVREINTAADAVDALQEAVELKLNKMLSSPDAINLQGVKDIKGALDMIEDMKKRYKADSKDKSKGLSDEGAAEIRRKILGLSE